MRSHFIFTTLSHSSYVVVLRFIYTVQHVQSTVQSSTLYTVRVRGTVNAAQRELSTSRRCPLTHATRTCTHCCTRVRQTGHSCIWAEHSAHAHWWPHGNARCVLGLAKQMMHVDWPPMVDSGGSGRPVLNCASASDVTVVGGGAAAIRLRPTRAASTRRASSSAAAARNVLSTLRAARNVLSCFRACSPFTAAEMAVAALMAA